jgi:hypothetical protein
MSLKNRIVKNIFTNQLKIYLTLLTNIVNALYKHNLIRPAAAARRLQHCMWRRRMASSAVFVVSSGVPSGMRAARRKLVGRPVSSLLGRSIVK